MRISKIELCNFGSYLGTNTFEIKDCNDRNRSIVLIGGKNGAGKTTLFSGIKLCLYGYRAGGYQGINAFYRKDIRKYFNDLSKYDSNAECFVYLAFYISNGQSEDYFEIKRKWNIQSKTLDEFEEIAVSKNGVCLDEEALSDFDNYLLNLLPPELFDLFFFDGEQIADFFLDENGSERIKRAFMILCGYDTFDIIENNFKRIVSTGKESDATGVEFTSAKEKYALAKLAVNDIKSSIGEKKAELDSILSAIVALDKKYRLSGGVLLEEWNSKMTALKAEEKFREEKNAQLKRLANDELPFLIIHDKLVALQKQLLVEHEKEQMEVLQSSLQQMLPKVLQNVYQRLEWKNDDELTALIMAELSSEIAEKKLSEVNRIINISGSNYDNLILILTRLIALNKEDIIDAEKAIEQSVEKSQLLRGELDSCNIDGIQEYLTSKEQLLSQQRLVGEEIQELTNLLNESNLALVDAEAIYKREEKKFEEIVKSQSVSSLASRAIGFLDSLQTKLYRKEIDRVQELFIEKIHELARKTNFIDEIKIDDNFGIHIFKKVGFKAGTISNRIKKLGAVGYAEEYGITHCEGILMATGTTSLDEYATQYYKSSESFEVLQEIDKSRLSKGEKQVFIMALYWAIMHLSQHEVPFIIDTPFARIDSEHRMNITKRFFMDLQGQVFVFSTNEEIVEEHYLAMEKQIQTTFLLENIENKCTTVIPNCYFGGENNAV